MNLHPQIRRYGPIVVGVLAIFILMRVFVFSSHYIPSESMAPTLTAGDRVVVNHLSYSIGEIQRGQVIVFESPPTLAGDTDVIKRVIALPGETIHFRDDKVYIGSKRVDEPYLAEAESTRGRLAIQGCAQPVPASDMCEIPDGHVFVLGDNRRGSTDSRTYGPIAIDSIVGRAFLQVWPLNNIART